MLRAGKTQIVKKNKMNVLILGASSDIGLEVTKIFLDKGFEVTAHCYKNKKIFKKFNNYKKINSLQIGVTNTKIHKNNKKKNLKKRISLIPIKRMATTAEVADYIYFLCSKENRLITNQNINISGGE